MKINRNNRLSLKEILDNVCCLEDVNPNDVKSTSRHGELVEARMIYYKIAQEHGYNYREMCTFINRTHATAINGLKMIHDLMSVNSGNLLNRFNKASNLCSIKTDTESYYQIWDLVFKNFDQMLYHYNKVQSINPEIRLQQSLNFKKLKTYLYRLENPTQDEKKD